jgi:hypothetical protein
MTAHFCRRGSAGSQPKRAARTDFTAVCAKNPGKRILIHTGAGVVARSDSGSCSALSRNCCVRVEFAPFAMGLRQGRLNARGWRPNFRSVGNSGSKPGVPAEAAVRIERAGQEAAMARPPSRRIVATLFKRFDAQHWRDRAGEARANAAKLDDPDARRLMFEIAITYDHLAIKAEEARSS